MKIKVREVRNETEDAVSITFEASDKEIPYQSGQYLTLLVDSGGETLRRCYSLCSSPVTDTNLQIAVKKVRDGRVSTWLNDTLAKGDELEILLPDGHFTVKAREALPAHIVFVAGGSGITPVFSMIKTILKAHERTMITLIYANRDERHIMFGRKITALSVAHPDRFRVIHVLDEPGQTEAMRGPATVEVMTSVINDVTNLKPGRWYLCGPAPMMENTVIALKASGIDEAAIKREYFRVEDDGQNALKKDSKVAVDSEVTVIVDGDEFSFTLNGKGMAILDAAMDAGAEVPFSCKGGVCCTCKAKVMSGSAVMDKNFALSEGEVAQGYILTCQAHPITPEIEVDYDEIY